MPEKKRVLLIGAGPAGQTLAQELAARPDGELSAAGFVDDDPALAGQTLHGLPVLGTLDQLAPLVARHAIDHVLIAAPDAARPRLAELVGRCAAVPVRARLLREDPGERHIASLRDAGIDDLLGFGSVGLDAGAVGGFLRGTRVMITGAGGSIGAELCRQVCRFQPAALTLVERAENNLFAIDRELAAAFPSVQLTPAVADIGDGRTMQRLFARARPQVVIHAAAHKHVPLMEQNVAEAVKNNVFGTRALTALASAHGVGVFVLISTDKAVNPTSVMGATKRVAELHVQTLSQDAGTRFLTTRFGNVMGSAGSVLPIFQQQIQAGGPVTVTHPDMKRYFMSIPEASQLVLQAAAMGRGGEIFVLDMGAPVSILTLAEQVIRLAGLRPHQDIEIRFTGIRPGEKLFEQITLTEEEATRTDHPRLFIGRHLPIPALQVQAALAQLEHLLDANDQSLRTALLTAAKMA